MRFYSAAAVLLVSALISACTQEAAPTIADETPALPDWSGVWMGTGTLFDQSSGEIHRFEPRSAESIDRAARNGVGQSRQQPRHAGYVAVVLTRLVGGTEVHVLVEGGMDA